jgi:ABC-2 type transport system ATP-binding protein
MHDTVIKINGLTKRFRNVTAVDDISFALTRGVTTGLLGGNGAGKTTTIGMMLGLIVPSGGSIEILGQDMLRHRHRVLPRLNFSSPYVDFPNRLKVGENLMVFAQLYGIRDARARIGELAADLNLEALLGQKTGSLSSGQKTRVGVAKALLNQPEILLLDEPTASLDPDTADWVRTYLERYQRATGASILLASHNMAEVERLCQDVLMMKAGKIVDRGAPAALITRYGRANLEEVFLDIARNRSNGAAAAQ